MFAVGAFLLLLASAFGVPRPAAGAGGGGGIDAVAAPSAEPAADAQAAIGAFSDAAETLYQAVAQGDRLLAGRSIAATETALRSLPMAEIATAEGVQALAASVAEMKRAWASVQPDDRRIEQAAGAIRLAADALANPQRPMWLQYRPLLREDTNALEKALKGVDAQSPQIPAAAREALANATTHYGLIRTAAALRSEPSAIERSDSVLRYAKTVLSADRPASPVLAGLAQSVRDALDALFPPGSDRPTTVPVIAPPTWGIAATIGSFIITVLSWAGWRRYRYDRTIPPGGGRNREGPRGAAGRWMKLRLIPPGSLRPARRVRH